MIRGLAEAAAVEDVVIFHAGTRLDSDGALRADGGRVLVYYASEERYEHRDLARDLSHVLSLRVEMRQIGARDEAKARLLLAHGANPNARATIRKQLRDMGDAEKEQPFEFRNVTPIGYATRFQEPRWVSQPALALLRAHGGSE